MLSKVQIVQLCAFMCKMVLSFVRIRQRWSLSVKITDLYYFFYILYRLFESYFYHVATDELTSKWQQVPLNGVEVLLYRYVYVST